MATDPRAAAKGCESPFSFIRSEVEAALQCVTDDHTRYHLKDIPRALDEAERHLAAIEAELVERRVAVENMAEALRLHKDEILRLGGALGG